MLIELLVFYLLPVVGFVALAIIMGREHHHSTHSDWHAHH
jgi:hypothetical protein